MKKLILVVLAMVLTVGMAYADYLTCDPPPSEQAITHYKAYDNGTEITDNSPAGAYGEAMVDLGEVDSGQHIYTLIACNERGCSEASNPFVFPSVAGQPQNLRLEVE